jgi:exodeoxyribonuclease VII small subunit
MAAKKPEALSFDAALSELELIVQELEQGDVPLETALKQFERGIQLARVSKQKLDHAEQQVQVLLQQGNSEQLAPFAMDSDDESDAEV